MKKVPAIVGAIILIAVAMAAIPQGSLAADVDGPDKALCEFLMVELGLDVPLGECMSFFAMLTNPATNDEAAATCQQMRTFGIIEHTQVGQCVSALKSHGGE